VFSVSSSGVATLDGLAIVGGHAYLDYGGGIYNAGGILTLTNAGCRATPRITAAPALKIPAPPRWPMSRCRATASQLVTEAASTIAHSHADQRHAVGQQRHSGGGIYNTGSNSLTNVTLSGTAPRTSAVASRISDPRANEQHPGGQSRRRKCEDIQQDGTLHLTGGNIVGDTFGINGVRSGRALRPPTSSPRPAL